MIGRANINSTSIPSNITLDHIIDELDDLDAYDGNTVHDMWVDYTYQENTNEQPDIFYKDVVNDFINNLNNWD